MMPMTAGSLAAALNAVVVRPWAAVRSALTLLPQAEEGEATSPPRQPEMELGQARRQVFQPPHRHMLAAAEHRRA